MRHLWILFVVPGLVLGVQELLASGGEIRMAASCFGFALTVLVVCRLTHSTVWWAICVPVGGLSSFTLLQDPDLWLLGIIGAGLTLLVLASLVGRWIKARGR